jgi:hypothetical protein
LSAILHFSISRWAAKQVPSGVVRVAIDVAKACNEILVQIPGMHGGA